MGLQIAIESTEIITKRSKKGTDYFTQVAYVHTCNRDGSPKRYPEQVNIFPKKDAQGNAIPYPKGDYELADTSYRVNNGFLEMAFPDLKPVKK